MATTPMMTSALCAAVMAIERISADLDVNGADRRDTAADVLDTDGIVAAGFEVHHNGSVAWWVCSRVFEEQLAIEVHAERDTKESELIAG